MAELEAHSHGCVSDMCISYVEAVKEAVDVSGLEYGALWLITIPKANFTGLRSEVEQWQ